MTEKRFTVPENYRCIQDNLTKEHYLCEDKTEAINLTYLLNELAEENEQLKSDNFNLNKSVECLDETVKEQCNKLDWADECGVRWEKEYNKWIGGKNDRE